MLRVRWLWIVILLPLVLFSSCQCSGDADEAQVRIGGSVWKVELAADERSLRRGLSGRDEIPEGTGMLFIFADEQVLTFHMLDCRTSIDIAFISADGKVVNTFTMQVEQDPLNPEQTYSSALPARFALEVAGGAFRRAGVKIGDKVEFLGRARRAVEGVSE